MTVGSDERQAWLDFKLTLLAAASSALARHELAKRFKLRFEFKCLTGAEDDRVPPTTSWTLTPGSELAVKWETGDDGIWVRLQLQGSPALDEMSDRAAWLKSRNGVIRHFFKFDEDGSALCVLADEPEVQQGLGEFKVFVDEEKRRP